MAVIVSHMLQPPGSSKRDVSKKPLYLRGGSIVHTEGRF